MKKIATLLLVVALVLSLGQAVWAAAQDFTVVNATGKTIDKLFVAHASENDWGSDILGRDVLNNGEYCPITFTGWNPNACKWDLRVEMTDGQTIEWDNLNLCNISKITLKPGAMADLE